MCPLVGVALEEVGPFRPNRAFYVVRVDDMISGRVEAEP